MRDSIKQLGKVGAVALMAGALTLTATGALADISLRLSHSAPPGSERDVWTQEFAKRAEFWSGPSGESLSCPS
ncbi:hypothetical protein [Marinobacterium rhizophilum]|uniref:Uncharacterized protein n=1 Tax=Marinobacterium rhizophilum TaxID=420402 RepID=A0ABY5HFP7_9GAMM|nr:hypothetical protein [Marinobacterium rhizophilum]UTW11063.1 hypothetical protein KDW95_17555 [Marinobacterium rhizophilum]